MNTQKHIGKTSYLKLYEIFYNTVKCYFYGNLE